MDSPSKKENKTKKHGYQFYNSSALNYANNLNKFERTP